MATGADTPADHIAYLRSRTYDQRAQRAAECMERLVAENARLREQIERERQWRTPADLRVRLRNLAEVARLVQDTATIETPPELLKAAREALGE